MCVNWNHIYSQLISINIAYLESMPSRAVTASPNCCQNTSARGLSGWGVSGGNFTPVNLVVSKLGSYLERLCWHQHSWMEESGAWSGHELISLPALNPTLPGLDPSQRLWAQYDWKRNHSSMELHNHSQTPFCVRQGRTAIRQSRNCLSLQEQMV